MTNGKVKIKLTITKQYTFLAQPITQGITVLLAQRYNKCQGTLALLCRFLVTHSCQTGSLIP